MPMVTLRVDEKMERVFIDDSRNMQLLLGTIAQAIPGNLDPYDDLDVNVVVRHPLSHSKYRVTVEIEMMETDERAQMLDIITKNLHSTLKTMFGSVNLWIKLVHAGYAPSD